MYQKDDYSSLPRSVLVYIIIFLSVYLLCVM